MSKASTPEVSHLRGNMKSPRTDTFTERMMNRTSSMTLLRRRRILQSIEDTTWVSSSPAGPTALEAQMKTLSIENPVKKPVEKSKMLCEPEASTMDSSASEGSPKAKRRHCRPAMESTRISTMPQSPEVITRELIQIEGTIPPIIVGPPAKEKGIPEEVEIFPGDVPVDNQLSTSKSNLLHVDVSQLNPEERTPLIKRIARFWSPRRRPDQRKTDQGGPDHSIKNQNVSKEARDKPQDSTLNRSLYRSFSQRIKKRIRATIIGERSAEAATESKPQRHQTFDQDRMEMLENILKHMKIQQCTIEQASKALNVCRTNKEFAGSSEELESERLLLIAQIRKRLLQQQLQKLSSTADAIARAKESSESTEWAEVTIENIELALRKDSRRESLLDDPAEWFLVVVIEGTNVWASAPVVRPAGSRLLGLPNFLCIVDNLRPNFRISIEVYCLKMKVGGVGNEEERNYTLNCTLNRTWTYLSPSKLLRRADRTPRAQLSQPIRSTSFNKCGQLELTLRDLTLSSPWTLSAVPTDSILRGIIDVNLSCKLHLSSFHQGFLNFGEKSGDFVSWNRRWCVLKGCTLMFWNYPRDQECKPPIKIIDLMECCSRRIAQVDREIYPKPRTILLEILRPREPGDIDGVLMKCRTTHTIQRYLLSFDNKKTVADWMLKLNNVVVALGDWNVKLMKNIHKLPTSSSRRT